MKRYMIIAGIVSAFAGGGWVVFDQVHGRLSQTAEKVDENLTSGDDALVAEPSGALQSPPAVARPISLPPSSPTSPYGIRRAQDPAGDMTADQPRQLRTTYADDRVSPTGRAASQFKENDAQYADAASSHTDPDRNVQQVTATEDASTSRHDDGATGGPADESSDSPYGANGSIPRNRYAASNTPTKAEAYAAEQPDPGPGEFHSAQESTSPVNSATRAAPADSALNADATDSHATDDYAADDYATDRAMTSSASTLNGPALSQSDAEAAASRGAGLTPTDGTDQLSPVPSQTSQANPLTASRGVPDQLQAEGGGRPGSKRIEGPQTPQLVVQKFAPEEIQVGRECVFEIKVKNTGTIAAQNVQIHDEVPQGTRLVRTEPPAASAAGGQVVWDLGTLSPDEQTSVSIHLMPTDEGEIGSVATVKFESQASVRTKSTRPELALRLSAPDRVMIDEEVTVKIEVSNPGTGDASGVLLLENVPAGVSHPAGQSLEFEVGTLKAGETREMELILTAKEAGTVINTLTARGDASLNLSESVEFEVIAPQLEVAVDGPKRRFLDREAKYEVSVVNPGTAPARDVELVTRLPEGMKFVSANNSGHYDAATHAVYWSLEELPPQQHGTVELVALPVTAGEQTLEIEGTAQQGLKDKTSQSLSVEGVAAIMFEVVDVNDPIVVGEEATYEIHVVNQGSKEASNVQIEVELPAGLEPTEAAGESGHRIEGNRVVFEPLRRLAPKADTTYRVKAKGTAAGDQRVQVHVTTDEVREPVTKEESTRVYKDE